MRARRDTARPGDARGRLRAPRPAAARVRRTTPGAPRRRVQARSPRRRPQLDAPLGLLRQRGPEVLDERGTQAGRRHPACASGRLPPAGNTRGLPARRRPRLAPPLDRRRDAVP
ncbi:MAG: hypothetical protein F4018_18310 [Acidobacteria bacterium]|nr:hypothetical protein [Acidobacteriota bacterium]